ncbi:MAG: PadR family transcriptional regulator [Cyclobacteriaceae bacterium]|nr:PadR family transcriptional regulator [Cyclobacteriaceae bacterium]
MKEQMKLGEFEEVVMLTVAILFNEAYGVVIRQEIEDRLERKVSVGAMQTALRRLEDKGYLKSRHGEATEERGGKRKKYFTVTPHGRNVLAYTKESRQKLWDAIPGLAFEFE